jgi:hypothetical protein
MNAITRHSLVSAAVASGLTVMEKSASASPEQAEVLQAAWPSDANGNLTKLAALSQILATGLLVEEAEASAG